MITPADETTVAERIGAVISAVAERIHYAENRRSNYASMGGALIAAGIGIFTFAWGAIDQIVLRWAATAGSLAMLIVGGLVLWVYGIQTNRYPYIGATKTWKWFYRDAIPINSEFDLRPASYYLGIGWKNQKKFITQEYQKQLPKFKIQIQSLSNNDVDLDQDVEQLFSLHLNEKYKNKFLSDIRSLFNYGLLFIVASTGAGGVYGTSQLMHLKSIKHFHYTTGAYTLDAWVKLLTPALEKNAQVSVKALVSNKFAKPIRVSTLRAFDQSGWPLPLEIVMDNQTQIIPPGGRATYFATAKASLPVEERVRGFSAEAR